MSEKVELLKTLGFSDELLKYFQEHSIVSQMINEDDLGFQSIESYDLTDIPNFDQVEIAGSVFTFASKE